MEKHEKLTEWAKEKGVQITGVAAHEFPGRGLGIIATRDIKPGEIVVSVPTSALISRGSLPKYEKNHNMTTHCVLATHLMFDKFLLPDELDPWTAILPSMDSFKSSLPLLWSKRLQKRLPYAARKLLENQDKKFGEDWLEAMDPMVYRPEDYTRTDFMHAWILVNTRTFYYTPPNYKKTRNKKRFPWLDPDPNENMALNPFADYFNHSSPPTCEVSYSEKGFDIEAVLPVKTGEEVYISYGKHSNDFLLAEYGFIMDENENDSISMDDLVMKRIEETGGKIAGKSRRINCEGWGFWGKYTLDKDGVCYRTQVALKSLVMSERRWEHLCRGNDIGEDEEEAYVEVLREVLEECLETAKKAVKSLQRMKTEETEEAEARDTLMRRWKQIVALVQKVLDDTPEVKGRDAKRVKR